MGDGPRKRPDDRIAPKLKKINLPPLGKVLESIGKPFYFLLSYTLIFFLFFLFLSGRFLGVVLTRILRSLTLFLTGLRKGLARLRFKALNANAALRLAAFKIRLPRFKLKHVLAALALYVLIFASASVWEIILKDLPSPEALVERDIEVSTKIYDRSGILLYNIYKEQNRTPVPLDKIPLHVRLATLAIEDAEFYNHPGISFRGIARAAIKNIRRGELAGGSTITQQLVKNTLLSPEKTLIRKMREIILAIRVELKFSKDQILEMYLNEVSYGGTAYGIQEAARVYLGKDVNQLSLAEAALLAGLPKSPTRYSPFGPNPNLSLARQNEVLNLMKINGFITDDQLKEAFDEEISFTPNRTDIKAPHFVMYVRQLLEEKYGKEVVEAGGLEVVTTLDYSIQKLAEDVVAKEVERLSGLNVGNGAAVVINPQTGHLLAMVGSKNYFDLEADGNVNVTTRPRQPGSSIKVVNYSYALSNGYTPVTILSDSPVKFTVLGQPPYSPSNYDGKYRGKLTLRSALAESRNVPAVKVLASYGVDKMLEMGKKMGISTWSDASNYGLSLTLGGGEVTLLDLTRVYGTIANYGKRLNLIPVLKVTNYKGRVLEENTCSSPGEKGQLGLVRAAEFETDLAKAPKTPTCKREQVLDPRVAYLLIDILHDNKARSPAFGSNSLLIIPKHDEVAVKTGTSNDLRDNLAIGFNQKYLVAVWVGNNDNSPMARIASGITGATPIFNEIMSRLLAGEESREWPIPEGLVKAPYCTLTGTLPCQGCPTRMEWFLEENAPTKTCNPDWFKKEDEEEASGPEGLLPGGGEILEEAARTEIIDLKKKKKPRPFIRR